MRWLSAFRGQSADTREVLSWLDDRHGLVEELGRGATCVVYHARNRRGESYALKVPLPGGPGLQREAEICSAVDSPFVVRCLGTCSEGSALYLKLELMQGETLEQRLARKGRLKLPALQRTFLEILNGLEAVHAQGLVHGDLKPGNLFLSRRGRRDTVKLMDFGLAVREGESQPGGAQGTAAYAAPEQWDGAALDRRCDLYSLGVVLYEMATGLLPWGTDDPTALLGMKRKGMVGGVGRYRSDFSADRDRLLVDLLSAHPPDRPHDVAEVRRRWLLS